jgi:RNA 2',3'-cyclic 3'-phosphodiesterase
MRLFIAVKITDDIRKELAEFVDQFLQFPGKVKWVEPHNMHMTLKFLGETDPKALDKVKAATTEACKGFGAFDVNLSGCGAFPNLRAPKVFWVGIIDDKMRLRTLAQQIDSRVAELGFEREERPFSPHLTLGRVKEPDQLELIKEAFGNATFPPQPLAVKAIYLIESRLRPSGPVYTDVAEFAL